MPRHCHIGRLPIPHQKLTEYDTGYLLQRNGICSEKILWCSIMSADFLLKYWRCVKYEAGLFSGRMTRAAIAIGGVPDRVAR